MNTKKVIFTLVLFFLVLATSIGWMARKDTEESEKVIAEEKRERIVLLSVPSDIRYQMIYLMADKITWMDYENFVVQVNDSTQETLYHFPNWYHGKYPPDLFYHDVNGDSFGDIIIVLNNDKAGMEKPRKDIHILNFIKERGEYEEAIIESIEKTIATIDSIVTLEKHDNIVTIHVNGEKYVSDISEYNFMNPREPLYISFQQITYSVENGQLFGRVPVYIAQDSVYGGLIGLLKLPYVWDGDEYIVKQIKFLPYKSDDEQFFFSFN
ncbi:hypothetical protein [Psychrobacillus sp. NPDC093180]|uniref:hypothetical protein n=1 Tax=Psychrobacillus sp. NPDC093180 TaxID=3364489 RepID=UPI0037FD802C